MIVRRLLSSLGLLFLLACSPDSETPQHTPASTGTTSDTPALIATVGFKGDVATVPGKARVFVFMREVGQRMPLAVEAYAPGELPLQMAFGNPDSGIGEVEVVARLSMTGAVNKHPGDLEVVSPPQRLGDPAKNIALMIPALPQAAQQSTDPAGIVRAAVSFGVPQPQQYADAQVFVTAHSVDGMLGKMPVAVRKISPNVLPATVELSDLNGMVSLVKLSDQEQVLLKARLSLGGSANGSDSDWVSSTRTVNVGDTTVHELLLMPPQ